MGLWLGLGRSDMKEDGWINISVVLNPVFTEEKWEGLQLAVVLHQHVGCGVVSE